MKCLFVCLCVTKNEHFHELPPAAPLSWPRVDTKNHRFLERVSWDPRETPKIITSSRESVRTPQEHLKMYPLSWSHNPTFKALPSEGWLWPSDIYEIFRADFVDYAKGSKAVKALLEKEGRPATPGSNRFLDLQVSLAHFRSKYCQMVEGIFFSQSKWY